MPESTRKYYDDNPETEWDRLVRSPYRRIEFEVVLHALSKYLPPAGHILDLGGGPGRYAMELAKRGYRVTLVDTSPAAIELARRKIIAGGTKTVETVVGDARDLSRFAGAAFDGLLCMGPLYHILNEGERAACLRECNRVLKPGAPLLAMVIPRHSFVRDLVRSNRFVQTVEQTPDLIAEVLAEGHSRKTFFSDMYYCNLGELDDWFSRSGFEGIEKRSAHGLAAFMEEQVNEISNHPNAWNRFMDWVFQTCGDTAALAAAEYVLCIARKRGSSE